MVAQKAALSLLIWCSVLPRTNSTQARSTDEMLAEVGEGGFEAAEFELQEVLGQISVQQVRPLGSVPRSLLLYAAHSAARPSG